MRDPARISVMLNALHEVWARNPDMRLGQLLLNVANSEAPCPELFYIEDEHLLRNLNKFTEHGWSSIGRPPEPKEVDR